MGRSQETFNKKEVKSRQEKKRKAKVEKRERKKAEGKKTSFDEMIAYADEYGRISSTPHDPGRIILTQAENIKITTPGIKNENKNFLRDGIVISFNDSKGYGFIKDIDSNKNFFVHINNLGEPVKQGDRVIFEAGKGSKGPVALKVRLLKDSPTLDDKGQD